MARLQVPMWSPGIGILSYFLLFAMFLNWQSGDCYLYILDYYRIVIQKCRSRRGRDHMVVRLKTTYSISAYHLHSCELESRKWRGVLDTTLCDWICKWFATGLSFSPGTPASSTNKTDHHIFCCTLRRCLLVSLCYQVHLIIASN